MGKKTAAPKLRPAMLAQLHTEPHGASRRPFFLKLDREQRWGVYAMLFLGIAMAGVFAYVLRDNKTAAAWIVPCAIFGLCGCYALSIVVGGFIPGGDLPARNLFDESPSGAQVGYNLYWHNETLPRNEQL